MSSEALERAERIRENISHVARGCRSASSHNPAPYLNTIEAALVALLADVARLEQELRDARQGWDGWQAQCLAAEAALAVARERGQRVVEALQELYDATTARLNDAPDSAKKQWHAREVARAALADEPAAAADEPTWDGDGFEQPPAAATLRAPAPPGSASAAADEPGETPA